MTTDKQPANQPPKDRPMPTDPLLLAQAMFQQADRKLENREPEEQE